MGPGWRPYPENREVSSTFPQRLVRVPLQCHLRIVTNPFRSLYKQEKVVLIVMLAVLNLGLFLWCASDIMFVLMQGGQARPRL